MSTKKNGKFLSDFWVNYFKTFKMFETSHNCKKKISLSVYKSSNGFMIKEIGAIDSSNFRTDLTNGVEVELNM